MTITIIPEIVVNRLCDEYEKNWTVRSVESLPDLIGRYRRELSSGASFSEPQLRRLEKDFVRVMVETDIDQRKVRGVDFKLETYAGLCSDFEHEVIRSVFSDPLEEFDSDSESQRKPVLLRLIRELVRSDKDENRIIEFGSPENTESGRKPARASLFARVIEFLGIKRKRPSI